MLITRKYLKQQRKMHRNLRYGAASKKFAPAVAKLITQTDPASILDYGAGKCALRVALAGRIEHRVYAEYDPAIARISKLPGGTFDLVCCIDVLEHIEPDCLDAVLRMIRKKTGRTAFLTIHTGPAGKRLPDGRNAHLIQEPIDWWIWQLCQHFAKVDAEPFNETTFFALCEVST